MKRFNLFAAFAAIAAVSFSCAKESEMTTGKESTEDVKEEKETGHEAVIGLSLVPNTKTSHLEDVVGGKTNVKTIWESGDKILVSFTKEAVEYNEVFDLSTGENTANGVFIKADSNLEEGISYSVTYYSSNDYSQTFSWAVQNGSVEDIPEYLTSDSDAVYPAAPSLVSKLVHFHFILNAAEDPGDSGLSLANAYFSNSTHPFIVDTDGTEGEIKVTPASAFTYSNSGVSTNADFYVSVQLASDSASDIMTVDLMNGDHFDGIEGYSVSWSAKSYSTEKVYKFTSVASGTEKVLEYQDGLVGSRDNTTGFYLDHSTNIEISVGKRLELQYINYNKGTGDGWFNADLVISNTKDNYENNASYRYFFLRQDAWGEGANLEYIFKDRNGYPDKYFADFMSDMNGAVVNVTIDHGSAGYVSIAYEATSTSSNVLHQYYSHAVSAVDPVYAFYTCDQSHLVMKSAVLSDIPSDENITGLSTTTSTVYYNGAATKMNLSPYGISVNALTAGTGYPVSNMYGASGSGLVSVGATASTVCYSGVTASSPTTINVSSNAVLTSGSILGGTDAPWADNDVYMFTVAPGTSQVVGAVLASRKTNNWDCPTVSVRDKSNVWLANLRLDNWGRGPAYKDDNSDEKVKVVRSSNWDWGAFLDNMDGSTLYITVSNNGNGKASIRYNMEKGTKSFYQYFDGLTIPVGEEIKFCISTEYCSLKIL